MKKAAVPLALMFVAFAVCICAFLLPKSDAYNDNKKYRQTFGVIAYETLNSEINDKKIKKIEPIFNEVKAAISYSGSKEDCNISQPLNKLCQFTDEDHYKINKSNVEIVTYKKLFCTGYLWIEYSRELLDENGNVASAGCDILCLIKIKYSNGKNEVTRVIEAP